jgi:dTDP-4-dehydrorhamnose 3,5-epimerase-like enzyme
MAELIHLPKYEDERGSLTVLDDIEDLLPFKVKRIFFINASIDIVRGGHRHHTTRQAIICIKGKCTVTNNDGKRIEAFYLDTPNQCLLLETYDWHQMHNFSKDSVLLVLASENFDPDDYIYEPYKRVVNDPV